MGQKETLAFETKKVRRSSLNALSKMRSKEEQSLFISYQYGSEKGIGFGFGNTTQFTTKKKHLTLLDLRQMEQTLKEENNFNYVVIMNYQFM